MAPADTDDAPTPLQTPSQNPGQMPAQNPGQDPDQALAQALIETLTTRLPGLTKLAADDQARLREQARSLAAVAIALVPTAAASTPAPTAAPNPPTSAPSALAAAQRMDRVAASMRSPASGEPGTDAADLPLDPSTADLPSALPMMPAEPPSPPPDLPSAQPTMPPATPPNEPADRVQASAETSTSAPPAAPADAAAPAAEPVTEPVAEPVAAPVAEPVAAMASADPALRPGQIPATARPASAPPPSRLVVRIERNARAGEPYETPISVTDADGRRLLIRDCQVPPTAGVRYADGHLTGSAPVAGEYRLMLTCAAKGVATGAGTGAHMDVETAAGAATVTATATLIVNPDPRSLWRDLPSDRDAPGWKPDRDGSLLAGAGARRLLAVSQRGRSHAHHGGFRDDDFALAVTDAAGVIITASGELAGENRSRRADGQPPNEPPTERPDAPADERPNGHQHAHAQGQAAGWHLLAVADGAGSAPRARIGSRVAVETAVRVAATQLAATHAQWPLSALAPDANRNANPNPTPLVSTLAYQVLGTAAFEAVKAIEARARAQGCEPRDYATTLLLAAHRPLEQGELVLAFWVGDGALAAFDRDSGTRLLGTPDGGAFAGQTRFLDRDVVTDGGEIARRIAVAVLPRLDALFLLSDGVSDPWFPSDAALREPLPWQRLWDEIAPALGVLDQRVPDQSASAQSAPPPSNAEIVARMQDWLGFWSVGNHDDRTLAVLW